MITLASFARRVRGSHFLLASAMLALIFRANGQEKTTDLLVPSSCERVLPIASQMFAKQRLPFHRTATCGNCFEGSTAQLHDASGNPVNATTAYKRYVDHKDFPHSNIFRWYTERQFHAAARLIATQDGSSCKINLLFDFDFYGIELIAGLPVDGDRISGKSNLRLESEYLADLQKLVTSATPP